MSVSADIHPLTFEHGSLKFSARAMGEGPVVLCLHGFPDNAGSFRHQLPAIANAGYRAIALTLRGFEPSSLPGDADYTMETIATDILSVIDSLEEGPVHLIGHDWGAAVGYVVAAAAPERLRSLTALAVPHAGRFAREGLRIPKQLRLSWYMGFFNLPWISDWVVSRRNYEFIRKLWRDWSPGWHPEPDVLESVIATLSQPGVRAAALGYYRAALSLRALRVSAAEARYPVPVPTLALSGEWDGCIDNAVFEQLMVQDDFPMGLTVCRISAAGHFLHQERPDLVNERIIEWLQAIDRENVPPI